MHMPVSLEKVQKEAPHLVDLYKQVGVSLKKGGINPERYKAACVATFDHSGSTESGSNRLYTNGTMQEIADIVFAAALQLDDDGSMPVSLFDNRVNDLGEVSLGNCKGFLDVHSKYRFGGTSYLAGLQWIVEQAGFGKVNLKGSGGLFHKGAKLEVKATAPYPVYALFVTDGQPEDPDQAAEYLTLMSQLPIFVQFVGVGSARFSYLERLDELSGRFVDNAGFFDAKTVNHSVDGMLEKMLSEFPSYYAEAKRQKLVV
jgi:hypothetical protein